MTTRGTPSTFRPDMHPVQVSNDACFTVRYSTRPDKLGSQNIDLSHQGKDYLLKSDDAEYKGDATPGKDVEAVLIWDNEKNQYVLHFVEHNLRVSKVLKRQKQTPKPPKVTRAATPSVVATPRLSRPEVELPKMSLSSISESQFSDESSASDASDADDYGDLANELEGELGTLDSAANTIIGTAGAGVDDEEVSSEEE